MYTLCSRIEDPCLLLNNSKKFHRVALILACLLLNNWQNFPRVFKFGVSTILAHKMFIYGLSDNIPPSNNNKVYGSDIYLEQLGSYYRIEVVVNSTPCL